MLDIQGITNINCLTRFNFNYTLGRNFMIYSVVGNLLIFAVLLGILYWMQKKYFSFTKRVFAGLGLGIIFGALLQFIYTKDSVIIAHTTDYINIVGTGYVRFLQMIVIPLIMVSIISAILKLKDGASVGKITMLTIGILVFTTMVAALIGIVVSEAFHLTAAGLTEGIAESQRAVQLQNNLTKVENISLPQMILEFIPTNPFADMTGARKTSTIAVVIFSIFIGIAATGISLKKPEVFSAFEGFIKVTHAIVMRMVTLVLRLTPYGILALMTKVVSGANYSDILNLFNFVLASYTAIILMFIVHLVLVALVGINPWRYIKKIMPALVFAFTSRTSAGAIPINIRTQTNALGNSENVANFSASFGATIGQNGCAGIYPAMLAVMIAPTVGIDPLTINFMLPLIAIITISSFGVAGVGGGATFAALIVLSTINFPIKLAALLISIEPLIDMGRTALNVSGSITAGTITSRLLGQTDMKIFNSDAQVSLDKDELTS